MNLLDLMVLLVIALAVFRGVTRGLVDTLFSLAAWALAFLAGKWGAVVVADWLPIDVENPSLRYFVAFAVVFLVVLVVVLLVGHAISALVRAIGLGGADKLLGAALGLAKGALIVTGFTLAAGLTSLPRTDFWQNALLSDRMEAMARVVMPWVPADLAKHVRFES